MDSSTITGPLDASMKVSGAELEAAKGAYEAQRRALLDAKSRIAFDSDCARTASEDEKAANDILQTVMQNDKVRVYDAAEPRVGYGGQEHRRFPGDHFLSNRHLIEQTDLFRIIKWMPKGSHNHAHYNACLSPLFLVDIAKGMKRMFITSDISLLQDQDFVKCQIQFSIIAEGKEKPGNLFDKNYQGRQTMGFQDFIKAFPLPGGVDVWLASKIETQEEETYSPLQTQEGALARFGARTRAMKGLFNYETAYKAYTSRFFQSLVDDGISSCEIRPTFMSTNLVWSDDGTKQLSNIEMMEVIIEEFKKFQEGPGGGFISNVAAIYCAPRAFTRQQIKASLAECLELKLRWPDWIAGFDLVGPEAVSTALDDFREELIEFKLQWEKAGFKRPYLFHCGETRDDTAENLPTALLLEARRIGHGYALSRDPVIMTKMKEQGVCVEICPISNELLGLCRRIGDHPVYTLLAQGVHCCINSDNSTLYQSSLSHDFYQVMVGSKMMSLHGLKQLAVWSIEHTCMSADRKEHVLKEWRLLWAKFISRVLENYGEVRNLPGTK